ncbi:unnamed protein product [Sphagnum jensenii]|uniref:RING-type E3 ubiquitin transferase n=1 Tax=Sphagnum jensenii TaxID=128206 RepID=A0ABP0W2E6_9BRYO
MGGVCCCFSPDDFEDYNVGYPNGSVYQNCFCLRCCVRRFLRMYSTWFDDVESRDSSSPNQGVSGSAAAGVIGNMSSDMSLAETYRAPPRPLPYDTDPRYSRIPRDGLISRGNKSGMSHLHAGEGEPLFRSSLIGDGAGEALMPLQRWNGPEGDHEEQAPNYRPDSPGKRLPSVKGFPKVDSVHSIMDDEEFCPTCFDGYNEENPKITTGCGHHFHLGCIYDWMERSKYCPVCDKEMIFSESL